MHDLIVDFAGLFLDQMFLIMIDAYLKWPEVHPMKSVTADQTNDVMRRVFAQHGLCIELISDNGRQITSGEFKIFMEQNGIKHILSPAYHPSTNRQAENVVKTFKKAMKKALKRTEGGKSSSLNTALCQFLFTYRTTPHCTTKRTPSELMGRQLLTRLDLLHPDASDRIERKTSRTNKIARTLKNGDTVLVRDYRHHNSKGVWTRGTAIHQLSPCTYQVMVDENLIWKRHIDQLKFFNGDDVHSPKTDLSFPVSLYCWLERGWYFSKG